MAVTFIIEIIVMTALCLKELSPVKVKEQVQRYRPAVEPREKIIPNNNSTIAINTIKGSNQVNIVKLNLRK